MTRNFTHRLATRDKTPLLVGLVGPSGSGKTFSALRLATGFQRVTNGKVFVVDTEAGRSLQYAERFAFEHVPFGAPFAPLDYLDAIRYCIDNGASTVIVDSMSHEHEGPGGVLEMHAEECRRGTNQMLAWSKPKGERRRLINTILQYNCNFIFCFRAKEKIKPVTGQQPKEMGFSPIGGDEWMFEMTLNALLLPRTNGIPIWSSDYEGERAAIKLPEQFVSLFPVNTQLTEEVGETMARWSAGGKAAERMSGHELIAAYSACSEPSEFRRLSQASAASWSSLSKEEKTSVKTASDACVRKLKASTEPPPPSAEIAGEAVAS